MKVDFLHPRDSRTFSADVATDMTGAKCLEALIGEKFLEPAPNDRPYTMQVTRTQQQFLPEAKVAEAGIQEGDTIAINQRESGASN